MVFKFSINEEMDFFVHFTIIRPLTKHPYVQNNCSNGKIIILEC
jgi:hypothetical protein